MLNPTQNLQSIRTDLVALEEKFELMLPGNLTVKMSINRSRELNPITILMNFVSLDVVQLRFNLRSKPNKAQRVEFVDALVNLDAWVVVQISMAEINTQVSVHNLNKHKIVILLHQFYGRDDKIFFGVMYEFRTRSQVGIKIYAIGVLGFPWNSGCDFLPWIWDRAWGTSDNQIGYMLVWIVSIDIGCAISHSWDDLVLNKDLTTVEGVSFSLQLSPQKRASIARA